MRPSSGPHLRFSVAGPRRAEDSFRSSAIEKPQGADYLNTLDPATNPGKLPGSVWSDGQEQGPSTGELMGHELGHVRARVTGDPDSNGAALRIENKVRKVNKKKSIRQYH